MVIVHVQKKNYNVGEVSLYIIMIIDYISYIAIMILKKFDDSFTIAVFDSFKYITM